MTRKFPLTALLACYVAMGSVDAVPAEPLAIDGIVLSPLVEAETPARALGVIEQIAVAEGAKVKAGALLAKLDDRAAQLALGRAQLERDQAQRRAANRLRIDYAVKALAVAQAEWQRSQESVAKFPKSVSQSQLDIERLTVDKLQVEIEQARHERALEQFQVKVEENAVDAARLDLQLRSVRAPFAGVVTMIRARTGEWVAPGQTVCRMVAVETLRAEGFVDADRVTSLAVGNDLRFYSTADPATPHVGSLRFISPESDPITGQTRVWAEIDNSPGRLRPGMRGSVEIDVRD